MYPFLVGVILSGLLFSSGAWSHGSHNDVGIIERFYVEDDPHTGFLESRHSECSRLIRDEGIYKSIVYHYANNIGDILVEECLTAFSRVVCLLDRKDRWCTNQDNPLNRHLISEHEGRYFKEVRDFPACDDICDDASWLVSFCHGATLNGQERGEDCNYVLDVLPP